MLHDIKTKLGFDYYTDRHDFSQMSISKIVFDIIFEDFCISRI